MNNGEMENNNKSQDALIIAAGRLLIYLQLLENTVKLCCSFLNVEDKNATLENLFSEEDSKRHYTLGQIITF
jgi:hypothetical protein